MTKITTHLWFDTQALEAAEFYCSIFKDSRVVEVTKFGEGDLANVMQVTFELAGQQFYALNAGPQFTFNPAISLYVDCDDQAEVDELWQRLTADGGEESQCGWLVDKYGLSWQIIPRQLLTLMTDANSAKARAAQQAMLSMNKIELNVIRQAFDAA